MTITTEGLPRVTTCRLAERARSAPTADIKFRGQLFSFRVIPLTLELFRELGFNPSHFRAGANILLLDRENFRRFAAACGTTAEGGIYPLASNGDNEAAICGEIPYLPDRSRNIILPEDHSPISLAHEIAHDIFIGGGITEQERLDFAKNLLHWYRLSLDPNMPHQHKNHPFYQQVSQVCMQQYHLTELSPKYYGPRHWQERDFRVFASECFAYACETILFRDEAMLKDVPQPVLSHLRYLRCIDLQAIRQFQQATGSV
ncbi:MAG: hypothetical protein PHH60_02725 [Candidatus Margulisbacteria bacterium]|nr:hypothetical protein [Candidatus Margulisiibacteriota bacterium]